MTNAEDLTRSQLALEEARRGLAEQASALEALRARVVGLLAVVGLVAGLGGPRVEGWARFVVAVVLIGLLLVIGYVLAPRRFVTTVRASVVLDDPGWHLPTDETTAHLVRYLGRSFDENEASLERLNRGFMVSMCLTGVIATLLLLAE